MSYRIYVGTTGKNDMQLLGNNECYTPFIEELKKQGVEVDEEGCFGLEGKNKIIEIQPIIDILEQYIWETDKKIKKMYGKRTDIFNLRPNGKDLQCGGLTFQMQQRQENAYIFVTANLINFLKDNLEEEFDIETKRFIYKIKDGKEIWFRGF